MRQPSVKSQPIRAGCLQGMRQGLEPLPHLPLKYPGVNAGVSSRIAIAAAWLATVVFMVTSPCQATVLRGYVCQYGSAARQDSFLNSRSFAPTYEGTWQCVSTVTDSAVASVKAGQNIICQVSFVRNAAGAIVAKWSQPGWTETQATAFSWSSTDAQLDRTNYYYIQGMSGAWAARSRDYFTQVSNNQMVAQSYVDQYIDGHYLGRYRTKSTLMRLPPAEDLALQE
ncbi:MAG: hypothetical protein HY711_03035 [Candidatus Melainabacteria bacterium]|nr:hypothetical protein [Candidatus Melainabacteria bacterium]